MIQVGSVLQGTYRLDRQLGKGGMGAVFQASHVRLPKQFAIKVMHAEVLANKEAFARFRREAEISSSLGHPNIVEVHDFNETEEGEPYIVMELLEGIDLSGVLQRDGSLGLPRTMNITRALCSALSAVHATGVIHRDLKPQNVFLGRRGTQEIVKVLDFGISKISGSTDIQTKTSALIGTPAYMSPEQARGKSNLVDGRSDQFALGAMVYEMLCGRRAFVSEGDDLVTTLYRVLNEDPAPIGDLTPAINQVLLRSMSKMPEQRYPDAEAFLRALEDAVAGRPVQGRQAMVTAPPGVLSTDSGAPLSSLSAAASEVVASDDEQPAKNKNSGLLVVGGLVAAAAAAGFVFMMQGKKAASTTAPTVAAVQAPAPSARVSLRFVIKPAGARVTIDGIPLTSPILDLPRGSAAASLHAEADGFEPLTLPVETTADRTFTVELKAKPTPAPSAPAAKAASHHASSTSHPSKPAAPSKAGTTKPASVNKGEVLEDPFAQ
jgi:serine/threonine-protein kinase